MSITSEITSMQNQTAFYKLQESKRTTTSSIQDANDSSMFLTLMLQQLQNQDPTEPTDNTEWLAQLAQYSSLEQMTNMNKGLANCMSYLSSIYNDMTVGSEITQTLSLIGKEVTIKDPDDPTGNTKITGKVTEASFEDGTGKIKVGDKYYSIAYIVNVKDSEENNSTASNSENTSETTQAVNALNTLNTEDFKIKLKQSGKVMKSILEKM